MKITQEVRDYITSQKLPGADASQKGVEEKGDGIQKIRRADLPQWDCI
jgi:hypothetical protein